MDDTILGLIAYLSVFIFLPTAVGGAVYFFRKSNELEDKYSSIIDVDQEIDRRSLTLREIQDNLTETEAHHKKRTSELIEEYSDKRKIFDALRYEISILEESMETYSFGLYEPHFNLEDSQQYKNKILQIRKLQTEFLKAGKAAVCSIQWQVDGSRKKGEQQTKKYLKLMLRAFNGESDYSISNVTWNNIPVMEKRIEKAFEAVNKLGSNHSAHITSEYLELKKQELRLSFEYQEKQQEEKEEQRRIREQMREAEKVKREMDKAQKDAESEEKKYERALAEARKEAEQAKGEELNLLNEQLKKLELELEEAHRKKERAIAQAQSTKSGHVYIISNIGSFGEGVYKIGMTRRLEPMDRVKELGDASVPFRFDVHGMFYSENAPELENLLHRQFMHRRVNLVNNRKEFFQVSLEEIEEMAREHSLELELTEVAEAREFRESLAIRAKDQVKTDSPVKQGLPVGLV